ncbi:MAG TPA: CoA transferase, partial [Xanthobacteraceae bacterium]|nr:CoA transferase [Xanthobacteraceae bacterium]
LQAQIFMLDFQAARWLIGGEVPGQAGNNHPTSIPTGVFKTADGFINIASTGGKMWERLCAAIGALELAAHPDYADSAARSKNRDALNVAIERRLASASSAAWIARLNEAGVPCGPIYSIDAMFADPQVEHLKMARDVKKKGGAMKVVGQPVSLSRTPSEIVLPTPEAGEHTVEVLREFGFGDSEIEALRAAKAI